MTPEQWHRVEQLCEAALELSPADRRDFVDRACADDEELQRYIERLIASYEQSGSFLEQSQRSAALHVLAEQLKSELSAVRVTLSPGTRLGDYEVVSLLGSGGMGEVYRARDTRLRRDVAIKVLPPRLSRDPDRLRRFEQEARAAAALNHPNILAVHQMGTYEGAPYLVSELLEGETLREEIKRGPLPARKAIEQAVQIARGLAAAHGKGIAHRDLKPENLFVTTDGRVKILDFGLAKLTEVPLSPKHSTQTVAPQTAPGGVMGTVGYMSPEQARGEPADFRTDIFALGAVLYEMLSGKRAFQKPTSPETLAAILNEDPPALTQVLPRVPPALQRIVQRCLEKSPDQRFQSASDLAFALEALSDTTTYVAFPGQPTRARGPWPWVVVAALIVLFTVGLIAWMRSPTQARVQSIRQLTDDGQAKDEFARIDTDGSRVYFTEKYGGTFRLAQVAVSGGQVAPISTQIPAPYSASVAPDFSGLVVSENPLGRHPLWFQPLPAGAPRRLGNLESDGAVFAPQGTHIVYVNGAALYSANRDGEEARKLSELPGIGFCPAVSPDGKTIRVTVIESKGYSLWELGTDGKGLHQLSNLGSTSSDVGCGKWTLDGLHFVFQKASVDRTDIWAISENTWFVRHSMSSAAPLTNGPLSCSQPSPSIDGKEIFARCAKLRGELVRYDRRSQQFTPFLDGISAVDVTYSRDREWVVYVSYPDHALWRMRANGKDRLQLTYPPMIAAYPQISPDSTNIAFMSNEPSPNIYIVNLTGGTPRKVVDQGFYPYWSPDGKSIAFSSPRQTPHEGFVNSDELRTIELKSGRVSVIPQSQGKFWPIWTSEASLVAGLWDNSRLTRYDFRTHRWSDLAAGPFSDWGSTDGTYIYCTTMEPAPPAALRIRISDGRTERIADLSRIRRIVTYGSREFSLTPKGELLFTRDIGTQEIYALDVKWP